MASFEIKRAYERPAPKDGKRILVDRLWPRGLRKDAASLDLWSKEIAPTSSLRVWFDHRADRFAEFKRRYRDELKSNRAVKTFCGKSDVARQLWCTPHVTPP
jgi:uncharacterized protein YeaO (DUF488 family)